MTYIPNSSTLFRIVSLLIASLLLPAASLVGCGGTSTDTGNPPFADIDKIRVIRSDAGVIVSGNAGAVTAGADVEVVNEGSGDSAATMAGSDGSFEVEVPGSTSDDYRVVVTAGGNTTTATVGPGSGGGLIDRTFLLQSAEGYTPVADTTVRVYFADDGFGFNAGCNSYSGQYSLCDGKLCIMGFGSTEMGCDPERHAQDEWLADFFMSQPELFLDGDELTFTSADATLVFLDRELANPDRPLTGRLWTVDTLIDGMAASSVPADPPATLEFADDGTLAVFNGCNDVQYTYEVAAQQITLTLVGSTRVACSGAAGALAAHLGEVLTGTVTFEIDAQRLTVTNGSVGVSAMTD